MRSRKFKIATSLKLQAACLLSALCPLNYCLAQQYGWIDVSDHIPTTVGNANLTEVAAVGESVWIACSNLKGVFRSDDAGQTFVFDTLNVGIQGLYRFPDGQTGWAVGGAYGFKTIDGGENWTPVFIGSTLLSITFANNNTGYATGFGSVYRTDDGGTTWIKQSEIANLSNRDVMDAAFPDPGNPLTGFVCVANEISTVFSTNDGGQSWDNVTLTWVTSSVNDLEMINPILGYGVGGECNIFKYENNTWTFQPSSFTMNLNSVAMTPDGLNVWAVGNNGTILFLENTGVWVQQAVGLTDAYLESVDAVNYSEAYAVGMDKSFLKWTSLEGAGEQGGTEARQISLEVWPNPTTGQFKVQISKGKVELNSLELMDLRGNVLESYNNQTIEQLNLQTLEFDITRYPAGVYFVKIYLDDQMKVQKIIKI